MAWNYRMLKDTYKDDKVEHVFYRMAEVYYDQDNRPNGFSQSHDMLQGESKEELIGILEHLLEAVKKPTLIVQKDKLKEEE